MANTRISNLTASASNLASTDLAPVVQTVGVGPVKMTGLQLAGGLLGSTTFNGSTVTTSSPVLNLTQTWNAGAVTFTGLKFNAATGSNANSASGSLLLDLQLEGASRFNVTKAGLVTVGGGGNTIPQLTFTPNSGDACSFGMANSGFVLNLFQGATPTIAMSGSITLSSGGGYNWTNNAGNPNTTIDLSLTRAAAATLQLGTADAAAPVAQTFKVQGVVAGTSNTAGANFTIQGSQGTGTGAGGSIIFQVAPAGSSGTAQNAYITAFAVGFSSAKPMVTIGSDCFVTRDSGAGLFAFGSSAGTRDGNLFASNYYINAGSNGVFGSSGLNLARSNNAYIGWAATNATGAPDTSLYSDAANTLALRNGANKQAFNLYSTYTDASNYERLTCTVNAGGYFVVQTNVAGTGTQRGLGFGAKAASGTGGAFITVEPTGQIDFGNEAANYWRFDTSHHFVAVADNTYDIGTSTNYRPRFIYASLRVDAPTLRTATAYTVATLPAAGTAGRMAYVTDATAPTYLGALTGGGTVVCPVFDNGTAWVSA